jgi:hypothetical protein
MEKKCDKWEKLSRMLSVTSTLKNKNPDRNPIRSCCGAGMGVKFFTKGHERTFWCSEMYFLISWLHGYIHVKTHQSVHVTVCTLLYINYTSIKMAFKKFLETWDMGSFVDFPPLQAKQNFVKG